MATKQKLLGAAAGFGTDDPDFKHTTLLLDFDGTSDDDNNTFTDSGSLGGTVTATGDVVQGSFGPYGNNWSVYFDGSNDRLDVGSSGVTNIGSGAFTVEFWINTTDSSCNLLNPDNQSGAGYWGLMIQSGDLRWNDAYNSTNLWVVDGAPILDGAWHHVAVVRNSGTFSVYYDGVSQSIQSGSFSDSTNYSGSDGLRIGEGNLNDFKGYLSNVRIVSGTAIYTSAFDPPTEPFTSSASYTEKALVCQSNRFIDNGDGSNTIAPSGTPRITPFSPFKRGEDRTLATDGGSANFDANEYLTIADNSALDISGAMTAECWIYVTDMPDANIGVSGQGYLINRWTASGNQRSWMLVYGNNGNIAFYSSSNGGSSYIISTATGAISTYRWIHVAASWDGTNQRLFIDGDLKVTTSNTSGPNSNPNSGFTVNAINTTLTGTNINQYIADARYFTNVAIYTSSFPPPTAPLSATSDANTAAVLLRFNDAGIFDRTGINTIDTVGDARLGFAPVNGLRAFVFDGTGDYFSMPVEPHFDFGTADFTIESWVNLSATGQFNPIVYLGRDTYTGIVCDISSSNNPRIIADIGASWTVVATGSTALEKNRWYHLAFVRNGSSFKIYVDGVEDASATNSGSITAATSDSNSVAQIGYLRTNGGSDRYLDGYLDDLRVTNGVARYTSDFTPPTEIDLSADTHREYVTLFLAGEGPVNGQNNTFTDSSTNSATITETGSVVQGVFSPYGDNWANYFDGSGDYLGSSSSSDFAFGTGDFTAEFWFHATSTPSASNILDMRDGSAGFVINFASGVVGFYSEPSSGFLKQSSTLNAHEWYHVAAVRNGTDFDLYINGTAVGSSATNSSNFTANTVTLGARYSRDQQYFPGYISNVRLVKGTAVYTSNFTAPTAPLTAVTNTKLLTCASNRFVDESAGDHSLTPNGNVAVTRFSPFESNKPYDITTDGGSATFSGVNTDYLSLTHSADLKPGTSGAFSVELWYYPTAGGTTRQLLGDFKVISYPSNCNGFDILEHSDKGARIRWGYPTYADGGSGASEKLDTNQWNHIVFCRDAESTPTMSLFVNGVRTYTTTSNTGITDSTLSNFYIGWAGSQSGSTIPPADGNICDVRMLKGSTAYDPTQTTLTIPTSPLTAVTNTELLAKFQDSAIPDLSGINNIDTVGNAKVAGSDPTKYGSNSLQLDGTGDYLTFDHSLNEISFGTGDFTIEGWFYIQSGDEYPYAFDFRNTGSQAAAALYFYNYGNGSIDYYVSGSSRILGTSAGNDVWQHIAVCRSGTSTKMFVNGTQSGSTYTDSTNYVAYSGNIGIKYDNVRPFKGFIDDFRISKGVARYTANFTPPIKALPKH